MSRLRREWELEEEERRPGRRKGRLRRGPQEVEHHTQLGHLQREPQRPRECSSAASRRQSSQLRRVSIAVLEFQAIDILSS